ncbi:hypothetical protein [Evansella tamaricis]|uniref:Uncharacterized protein n=1 Tax=Evansella tamaricis TaxID=2069301 RepID=A0ABS6JK50_9BACI|nr:hypothetical protein [Evansella tamaricis]MBU9712820.1 hypothetical protein [Evansella tamaricis]
MGIYRPVKRWLLPLVAALFGLSIGFHAFPSSIEYHYKNWITVLDENSEFSYQVNGASFYNGNPALVMEGYWSKTLSNYRISSPDGRNSLTVFLEDDLFFVERNEEWKRGSKPHQVISEMEPLDHPFSWMKDILEDASSVHYEKEGEKETYEAVFDQFHHLEFMDFLLLDQNQSNVIMVINDGFIQSLHLDFSPVRHGGVGDLERYPDSLRYELTFSLIEKVEIPEVPEAARDGEGLD